MACQPLGVSGIFQISIHAQGTGTAECFEFKQMKNFISQSFRDFMVRVVAPTEFEQWGRGARAAGLLT